MKQIINLLLLLVLFDLTTAAQFKKANQTIQIIFTSDAHYGITRASFRGKANVDGHSVNAKMITKINTISTVSLPEDGGINAGCKVGPVDYFIQGGDVANRMEIPFQNAAASWKQFETDYIKGIYLKDKYKRPVELLLIPGNHDASNAIGFYKPMNPLKDPTMMVNMYNLMLHPAAPVNNSSYSYLTDKINYSKNIGGIHFQLLHIWPDSAERIWMEKDLQTISASMPVIIFTHDQPESEAKHFSNPDTGRGINGQDKFENLLTEKYKEGATADSDEGATAIEQKGWVNFLKKHPNIKAYFHGNSNFNEFYTYKGPDADIALNTFRVDSPMKGKYSARDETRLSFQLITIDVKLHRMTVRECFWNTDPQNALNTLEWGESKTVSL